MYVKDSCGLRKLPRFRDAATGWHRRNKQRNSILIWVVLPGLKLILLVARPPVSSIAFLRLFLRHHFAGKRAGVVKYRLFNRTKILRADWVDTPWRQLCLASYYLQQNIPDKKETETSVDNGARKSNKRLDHWAPEVVFSPFHALSRRQLTFPSCC